MAGSAFPYIIAFCGLSSAMASKPSRTIACTDKDSSVCGRSSCNRTLLQISNFAGQTRALRNMFWQIACCHVSPVLIACPSDYVRSEQIPDACTTEACTTFAR